MITVGGLNPAPLHLTLKRLFPHQSRHPLVVDLVPLAPKLIRHPAISVPSTLNHNLFYPIPKVRFLLLGRQRFLPRVIVIRAALKPHHFAPPLDAAKVLAVIGDERSFLRWAVYSTAFFKSSFSIVSLPTIRSSSAMRARERFSLCDGPSANPPSSSWHFFQYNISPGLTSCRRLSCAKLQPPLSNSPSTCLLNAAEKLLRSLINHSFLFSARHSKLSSKSVQTQGVTPLRYLND